MQKIKVRNTHKVNLSGKPADILKTIDMPKVIGVSPARLEYVKPKLVVSVGDNVKIGTVLFFDKKNESNKFLSPASGSIKDVVYGPKRSIQSIVIEADDKNQSEKITDSVTNDELRRYSSEKVRQVIQDGGLWSSFVEYPFGRTPDQNVTPPSIYVSLDNDEPFLPQSHMFIKDNESSFLTGMAALKQLCKDTYLGMSVNCKIDDPKVREEATHQIHGNYPANNPGVFLYYNKKSSSENNSWSINPQDVIRIGQLFETGFYPNKRIISLAGSELESPCYAYVYDGTPVKTVLDSINDFSSLRVIAGGVFTGQKISAEDYVSYRDFGLHVLAEGREQEFLHFFKPGFHRPTSSRTYMAALLKDKDWEMNTSLNGGHRACISCGTCVTVCPVDAFPQVIMKNLTDNDIETAMEQGVLDCVDCGLCTYVCPSKIELGNIMKDAKNMIAKEVGK